MEPVTEPARALRDTTGIKIDRKLYSRLHAICADLNIHPGRSLEIIMTEVMNDPDLLERLVFGESER